MTKSSMRSKLEILVRRALPRNGSALLAVSGGLDSMVLLDVAARSASTRRCRVLVATFDHASGAHSARAVSFVASRASAYALPVVIGRASDARHSEAAWRAARWEFLRSAAHAAGAVVVTAHTQDDQLETILMRALRDAGARGLAGLFAPSDVRRPFLGAARAELHAYANDNAVEWLEDPTNRSPRFLRNRVRRDLLPALRRVRPTVDEELLSLAKCAAVWRRDLAALVDGGIGYAVAKDECSKPMLDVAAEDLVGYSGPMLGSVWPELASRIGVTLDARGTRRASEFTISSRVGGRIQLSGGWELIRSRTTYELRAMPAGKGPPIDSAPLQVSLVWDRWSFRTCEREGARDPWTAALPADRPLAVRAWRPGDRLTITRDGRLIARKVKYFLSDAGISGHIRPRWPVVVTGDEIVWIPGVRRSDAATARSGRPVVTYVCDYLDRRS